MLVRAPLAHLLVPQLEPELVLDLSLSWLAVKMGVGRVEVVGAQVIAKVKEVVVEVLQELLEVVVEVLQELLEVVVEVLQELLRVTAQVLKMVQGMQQKEKGLEGAGGGWVEEMGEGGGERGEAREVEEKKEAEVKEGMEEKAVGMEEVRTEEVKVQKGVEEREVEVREEEGKKGMEEVREGEVMEEEVQKGLEEEARMEEVKVEEVQKGVEEREVEVREEEGKKGLEEVREGEVMEEVQKGLEEKAVGMEEVRVEEVKVEEVQKGVEEKAVGMEEVRMEEVKVKKGVEEKAVGMEEVRMEEVKVEEVEEKRELAIGLRGGESDAVAAVRGDYRRADRRAQGIADGDGGAGLAAAAHHRAEAVHCRGKADRRGDVGRVHGDFGRGIARRIGLGDLEQLAIGLGRGEGDAEAAIGGDQGGAERIAGGVMDAHRRARLAGAGHCRAVRRHARHGRGGSGEVGRGDSHRRGDIMGGVRLGDLEQLAVGLRGGERCAIAAIGGHGRGADHRAAGIAYRYGRAGLAAAGDDGAAAADCCRQAKRRGDVGRVHGCFGRDIARRIGLGDLEQLAIGLRRGEGDAEAATGSDQGGAERIAGGVMDAHRRARLAGAGHHRAVRRHARHGRGGSGEVGRGDGHRRGDIMGGVRLGDLEQLAIGLRGGEGDAVAAI
ncbi:MAG: hypothetical protein FRX49_10669, partial [Trebouxia sp. A1-2]